MHAVMKRKWVAVLSMALSAVPVTGCGTVRNMRSEHPRAYGGLASDFGTVGSAGIPSAPSPPLFPQGYTGDPRGLVFLLGLVLCVGATELCATSVADTLCLPYFYYRDGELFPKDTRSEDTRDFSAMPVQDSWPSLKPHPYSSADCVWNETIASYTYLGSEQPTDNLGKSEEKKDQPATSEKPPDPPPFMSVRDLVSWPDDGQSDRFATFSRSSLDASVQVGPDR